MLINMLEEKNELLEEWEKGSFFSKLVVKIVRCFIFVFNKYLLNFYFICIRYCVKCVDVLK